MPPNEIIRLGLLIGALAGNAALAQWAAGGPYAPPLATARTGAAVVLCAAAYLGLHAVCRPPPRLQGLPAMSLGAVCAYVYGLGLLAFVTVYASLALSPLCVLNHLLALLGVCVGDALERPSEPWPHRAASLLAAFAATAAVACVAVGEEELGGPGAGYAAVQAQVARGNWLSYVLAVLLPVGAPFLHHFIRGTRLYSDGLARLYSPGLVFELIHLALPFAAVLALVTLGASSAGDYLLATGDYPRPADGHLLAPREDRGPLLAVALLPLTSLLTLFFAVQSALLYSTVDFVTAAAFVVAGKHFAWRLPEPEAVLGMALAAMAFLLRLCASAACDDDEARAALDLEAATLWDTEPDEAQPAPSRPLSPVPEDQAKV